MKRIAIDMRPLLEARRAGVGTYAAEMTRALVARGGDRYALFSNAASGAIPADIPPEGPFCEHRFSHLPNRLLNTGFRVGYPRLESLIGPVDALWLPNMNFVATHAPTAVTVHDLSFLRYPRFFTAKQRLWHAAIGFRGMLERTAAIIAVSSHTKDDLMDLCGVPASRISVAPPAAHARYAPADADTVARVRATYGITREYFLFLGALEPRKNVEGLIDAFDLARTDADLVIAGGNGWLCEGIYARAARSKKRDRIRFIGYVQENDKPALYTGALAFAYPSFYEGFGMPPLEAMACGTPVVASRAASLGEVVADAGLLADPYDAAEIAAAMDAAATDSGLRAMLRERGFARAKAYSWEQSAAVVAEVLHTIS